MSAEAEGRSNGVDIRPIWHVLGPFQVGTREVAWGCDPLEQIGHEEPDFRARFSSSLVAEAAVTWTTRRSRLVQRNADVVKAELTLNFPEIDWQALQNVYGWAALQWQAWACGEVVVKGEVPIIVNIFTDGVLEFRLDGCRHFGGDFYSVRRAPFVAKLSPGRHRLDLRMIRDVRASGGMGDLPLVCVIELRMHKNPLIAVENSLILADMVENGLASPHASVAFTNQSEGAVEILGLSSATTNVEIRPNQSSRVRLAAGQTRPVCFQLFLHDAGHTKFGLDVMLRECISSSTSTVRFNHTFTRRALSQPHKYTFLHPSGTVSYAILRPPSAQDGGQVGSHENLPVFISLHGAGVDVDSCEMRHSLDELMDIPAWTVFPSGTGSWSGDDFHQWGFADVEAAIEAIPDWIRQNGWQGPNVDLNRWFVAGHSNGGQAVWFALTHRPDKIIAAAPISAYSSIQNYVPYQFWRESDPARVAIVQSSLNSYRHELMVENISGIPLLIQHGSADDNVPPYHSRRMYQLLRELGKLASYVEIPGAMHWFDGVMTTKALKKFYYDHVKSSKDLRTLRSFNLVTANTSDSGSKNGLRISELLQPGILGRLEVDINDDVVEIATSNVKQIEVSNLKWVKKQVKIDNLAIRMDDTLKDSPVYITRTTTDTWELSQSQRQFTAQLGGLDAILRTKGRFRIVQHGPETALVALQVSRNLHQYYAADSVIVEPSALTSTEGDVIISLVVGSELSVGKVRSHPIEIEESGVSVVDDTGVVRRYLAGRHGLCAIYLRNWVDGKLELVIWGTNAKNLEIISRLVPMLTGTGQPDFIIATSNILSKGIDAVLAMGFLRSSPSSVSKVSFFA